MWGEDPESPYYVVECKGCQTNSSTSMDQLRRGLEQVPSLVFGAGVRPTVTLVVATCMENDHTTVYVLDPPADEPPVSHSPDDSDKIFEKAGSRSWRVIKPEVFARRTQVAKESELLKWAGQFSKALDRDRRLGLREGRPVIPDIPLEIRRTDTAVYRGFSSPLFPELGYPNLRLFTGVEEGLLARIAEEPAMAIHADTPIRDRVIEFGANANSPYESLSRDGTCMIIQGVE